MHSESHAYTNSILGISSLVSENPTKACVMSTYDTGNTWHCIRFASRRWCVLVLKIPALNSHIKLSNHAETLNLVRNWIETVTYLLGIFIPVLLYFTIQWFQEGVSVLSE